MFSLKFWILCCWSLSYHGAQHWSQYSSCVSPVLQTTEFILRLFSV